MGTSGGVHASMKPGNLAISNYAVGLDSTGLYYDHQVTDPVVMQLESKVYQALDAHISSASRFKGKIHPYGSKASLTLTHTMQQKADLLKVDAKIGITASTPGFYGPSGRFVKGLSNTLPDLKEILASVEVEGLGILNMEMESSLIFHLCNQLGIKSSTICPTISSATEDTTLIDYQAFIDASILIALDTLSELA